MIDHGEHHPGDPIRDTAADFPEALAHLAHQGHPQRPSELDFFDVRTDCFSVFRRQGTQEVPNGLFACGGHKEIDGQYWLVHGVHCIKKDTPVNDVGGFRFSRL